ncbi:DUF1294 domain-containing protein [Cryobacterium sp. TMT1-62]|uniref:DUF1294 domain-containing protein n=1 Tax=unclassified Cryobacterium TaxID=2649013 RepID=UPI000CE4F5AB|nr:MULTISPECIES: DUF1294 domain-containing protein [unclassified Cryobacterium]TFB63003.1 DUF1294 domain-containing protein [Cryobacterium sp. Hz7]TFC51966.1 DUF1294 domain-containing protein [Cryobacterium sp. TMT2-17-1]TFC65456.1 DUF1294 domain-containing protein [Cryobacterium sp. TMT2-4]TFD30449.1 DUF1294 domain-containing protein [Cryobacterium sp. TMT1-62]
MRQTKPRRQSPRTRQTGTRRRMPARTGSGAVAYLAIVAFTSIYLVVDAYRPVSIWVAAFYLAVSLACFVAYAMDKTAAVAARWRVPENTLLLLGFAGGWPGAIVAQQVLRHKTKKAGFRQAFWGTVALNVLAFVVIFSPLLPDMLAR